MNNLYSYNRYTRQNSVSSNFTPTSNNWFISAKNQNGNNYYFPNLSSYNNWAGTCCGASRAAIAKGSFNGYEISYNRPF